MKTVLLTIENTVFLPIKIIKNCNKIIFTISTYYGIFLVFKYLNKNEIEKLNNFDSKKEFIKVEVDRGIQLPFDIVIDKDELNKKPMKNFEVGGMFLYLMKPATKVGKKCYEKFLEKNKTFKEKENSFGVNIRDSEVKIKLKENNDPSFDNFEEYDEFLESSLDEN